MTADQSMYNVNKTQVLAAQPIFTIYSNTSVSTVCLSLFSYILLINFMDQAIIIFYIGGVAYNL